MADVFISYARDQATQAQQLALALNDAGMSVWWDRQVTAGESWANLIERELDQASVVIVLWSNASVGSSWVRDEAAYARDAGKLVPVRIEKVEPPLGFMQLETANLTDWQGDSGDPEFKRLLGAVKARRKQ